MSGKNLALYGALSVLNLMLMAFSQQLGAGNVPIPEAWQWTVPILGAGVIGLTMLLPRLNSPSDQAPAKNPTPLRRASRKVTPPTEGNKPA